MVDIVELLRNRWSAPSLDALSSDIISGKTVLVTGANTGLGLEAARHYARLGASRVILGVRSQSKGEAAKQNILDSLALTSNDKTRPQVDVQIVDMLSFESVQSFAKRINEEYDSLDIALLNAGISKNVFNATKDGWDESIQVNMLSTMLLGLLILPKLQASSAKTPGWTAKLDFVASRAHSFIKKNEAWMSAQDIMKAVNTPEALNGMIKPYATSKLLLIYAIRELADQVTGPDSHPSVLINYTCPGGCKSDLIRDFKDSGALGRIGTAVIQGTMCKSAEEGSRTLVWSTCLGEESHGKFIHNDRIAEYVTMGLRICRIAANDARSPSPLVTSEIGKNMQKKIWEETLEILRPYGVEATS
jgi:retinol dehydrogenase-12